MRAWLVLVGLTALVAGCTQPTPETPSSPSPPPATPSPAAGSFEPIHLAHPFDGRVDVQKFDIPTGAGPLTLHMSIVGPDMTACTAATGAALVLTDPTNQPYARLDATGPNGIVAPSTCDQKTVTTSLAPGAWTVTFSGTGTLQGSLDVIPP